MERWLEQLAVLVAARPRTVLVAVLVAVILSVVAFGFVELEQDLTALFPENDPHVAVLRALSDSMAGTDFALVLLYVDEPDEALLKRAADRLGERLSRSEEVARVRWKIPEEERAFYADVFLRQGLLFLPPDRLEQALEKFSPGGIRREIDRCDRDLYAPTPMVEQRVLYDPLNLLDDVFRPLLKRRTLGAKMDFETGHTLSTDERAAMIRVWGKASPSDIAYARRFSDVLNRALLELKADPEFAGSGLKSALTGGYSAALRNERSVKRNLVLSFASAFFLVLVLFMVAYRSLKVNLTVGLPLAAGVTCAFGAAAPVLSFKMAAVAAAFASILAGLGIDFPLHLYNRFRDERAAGRDGAAALRVTLGRTGPGVIAAGLTTAMAFGLLALADFKGMYEVGLFVAVGLCAMLAIMVTALPAMLVLFERGQGRADKREFTMGLSAYGRLVDRAGVVLFAAAVLAVVAAAVHVGVAGLAPFERDMRNLQPPAPEIDRANAVFLRSFGVSLNPILAVVRAPTREEALDAAADFEARLEPLFENGTLEFAMGPGAFVPGPLRTARARARFADLDPDEVDRNLRAELSRHEFDLEPFEPCLERIASSLRHARGTAAEDAPAPHESLLDPFLGRSGSDVLAVTALYVPSQAGPMGHLVARARLLEAAAPSIEAGAVVTSMDILVQRMKTKVSVELEALTLIAAVMIMVVVVVHFRRPLPAILALLPVVGGFTATVSLMHLVGLKINFLNVVVFPMILGIGVDDGIHFVHRWREPDGGGWRGALLGAGLPIVMTSLTTMAGFGSLALTDNPGLRSVGWVALIGISACLIATLTLLPPLCRWIDRRRSM